MKRIIMLIVTCIMITGCSEKKSQDIIQEVDQTQIQEEEQSDVFVDEDVEAVEDMPILDNAAESVSDEDLHLQPLEISISTLENQFSDEGALLAHVKIEYPIIQNTLDEEGITKINEFFEESAQALYEENNTYASDSVEAFKEETSTVADTQVCYSEYLVTVEVKYNNNGYFSILEKFRENNNDISYSNEYSTGYVFDNETGERLTIDDILLGTNDEISQTIGQSFIHSNRISEEVKTKYKEELLDNTQYAGFYIANSNIEFFYNPDTVAPYSEGILEAYLPLNTDEVFELNLE